MLWLYAFFHLLHSEFQLIIKSVLFVTTLFSSFFFTRGAYNCRTACVHTVVSTYVWSVGLPIVLDARWRLEVSCSCARWAHV